MEGIPSSTKLYCYPPIRFNPLFLVPGQGLTWCALLLLVGIVPCACLVSACSSIRPIISPWTPSPLQFPRRFFYSSNPTSNFSYSIAASFIAKDRPFDPSTHVFHFNPNSQILSVEDERSRPRLESGHDAFFVSCIGSSGSVAMGVADGVGGWVDSGVDPGDFSHTFCNYMAHAAYNYNSKTSAKFNARYLMKMGYDAVSNDTNIRAGGTTACVAIANPSGSLEVANLGDSGYIVLRSNAVCAYSVPQTHTFNTPFQLSIIPTSILRRAALFGNNMLLDHPKDSDVTRLDLRHGDILVLATDGVWDNLFNHDILRIVGRLMTNVQAWENSASGIKVSKNLDPLTSAKMLNKAIATAEANFQQGQGYSQPNIRQVPSGIQTLQSTLAVELTTAARAASFNTKVDGPFAKALKKYYPEEKWHGGKVDDICVLVAVVTERSESDSSDAL